MMRSIIRSAVGLVCLSVSNVSSGLTTERDITPKFVTSHPDEFSITVRKDDQGLISFKLTHDVRRPMYHVAHLIVAANGKILAETSTPTFGKMHDNAFHFSVAPDLLPESKFGVSDSSFVGSGENAIPVPGTMINRFRLIDFVPRKLLDSANK